MTAPERPRVALRGEEQTFYDHLRQRELVYHRCEACASVIFPLRTVCPSCGSERLVLERASGKGVVHSFTIQHRPAHPFFADQVPYVLALTDLEEGFRVLSSVADSTTVTVGTPVVVVFDEVEPDLVLMSVRSAESNGAQGDDQ